MKIRKVLLEDAATIASIYNYFITKTTISFEERPLTVEEMRRRIEEISSSHPYFVAEENGRVVGWAYCHPWKVRAAYSPTVETTIYLDREYQHRGIGRQLLETLIYECRRYNFHSLIACITGDNIDSIDFHKSAGFVQVSHFKEVGFKFGRYLDVVDLELILG